VLAQLLQLTVRQQPLAEADEIENFLSILTVKQQFLLALQQIERQLEPFRSQDPERRVWVSAEARENVRRKASECEQLLHKVMQIERQCESTLVHRRDAAAQSLQGLHAASRANVAYSKTETQSSRLDLTSES